MDHFAVAVVIFSCKKTHTAKRNTEMLGAQHWKDATMLWIQLRIGEYFLFIRDRDWGPICFVFHPRRIVTTVLAGMAWVHNESFHSMGTSTTNSLLRSDGLHLRSNFAYLFSSSGTEFLRHGSVMIAGTQNNERRSRLILQKDRTDDPIPVNKAHLCSCRLWWWWRLF